MWLLTLTLCLSAESEAECQSHVQIFPSHKDCIQLGQAHKEYAETVEMPGVEIIFADGHCAPGTDS